MTHARFHVTLVSICPSVWSVKEICIVEIDSTIQISLGLSIVMLSRYNWGSGAVGEG